ncbi:hypothetical protein C8F04DRAFT_1105191 [Mycena alexandri]|uniref:Uncharacterized protein n=1 Tax=Mycena alexandri TaxID=1745969 RepID=A0AAD6ST02_9AGAR|nr:hypothetical protein C8F04DRAFT_1105191 [Mycena alexandri]
MDYGMAIPSPPISIRKLPSSTSNAIPTSSDRHSARSGNGNGMHPPASKKPRLNSNSHSRSSDEESNLTLPPPSSGAYNFPPVQPYRGGGGGGGGHTYGVSPTHSGGGAFFPPLFDPPPPQQSFRSQMQYDPTMDPDMYEQFLRTPHQQHQHQPRIPIANPFAVEWPVHAPNSGTQGAFSRNLDHFIHSIMYPDEFEAPRPEIGPHNWMDFLLPRGGGAGGGGGGGGGGGPSRSGSTSWERGSGGSGGGGGGGSGGRGGGDGGSGSGSKKRERAQSQSGSRSGSEVDRMDDKDG